jgi:hypothetical protein
MTHWQNSHVTLPSSWISVVLDRPQLRQCQFRTTVFMDARFLAEGRRRTRTERGAGPSEGSEETSLSRAAERGRALDSPVSSSFRTFSTSIRLTRWWSKAASRASGRWLSGHQPVKATRTPEASSASPADVSPKESQEGGTRVGWGGGDTLWRGVGGTGAGVPSIPSTRPAGVRRATTGVVSGVGGAGSAVCICAGWEERCPFEQPSPIAQRATAVRTRPIRFIVLLPSRTSIVASGFESLTHFGAPDSARRCK